MRYARIENNKVMEIIDFNPVGRFTEEIVAQFVECDETVEQNDIYENGIFAIPVITIDEKQIIINQLLQLDLIIPRVLEDIIAQGNFTLHQSKLDIISQKEFLRQQLQELV